MRKVWCSASDGCPWNTLSQFGALVHGAPCHSVVLNIRWLSMEHTLTVWCSASDGCPWSIPSQCGALHQMVVHGTPCHSVVLLSMEHPVTVTGLCIRWLSMEHTVTVTGLCIRWLSMEHPFTVTVLYIRRLSMEHPVTVTGLYIRWLSMEHTVTVWCSASDGCPWSTLSQCGALHQMVVHGAHCHSVMLCIR